LVNVTVTGAGAAEALENVPSDHVDVDKGLIARLPVRSPGNGLSEVVTLAAPGVVADPYPAYARWRATRSSSRAS